MVLYTEILELFCTSFRLALVSKILLKTVLKWFHHFLTDRQQCIMLQDPPRTFSYSKGVLQASGSVLGPLLLKLTRVRRRKRDCN